MVAQFLGIELDIWLGLEIFRGQGRGIYLVLELDPYCGLQWNSRIFSMNIIFTVFTQISNIYTIEFFS